MSVYPLLVAVHVIGTIVMVAGGIGRQFVRYQAQRAGDLNRFLARSVLAGRFETLMVRPGSLAVAASGIILAVLGGWPLFGFLQGAAANWMLVANLLVLSIILTIIFVFIPRGKIYEQLMQEAIAKGEITPALRASFNDPLVRRAHAWEAVATVAVIFLMFTKPF